MKKIIVVILLFIFHESYSRSQDSLVVVFWNVENFFDYMDQGTGESDAEFSSYGSRYWTKKRFYAKCDAVAKSFFWISEKYGRMPDVIGLAEVENRGVLLKLLSHTLLRKYDYNIVHFDSKDRRGIDVAMLYRKSVFRIVSSSVKAPEYMGESTPTRDILQVCLESCHGTRFNMIVNHHPSKYGGTRISEERRNVAMRALKLMCDSIILADKVPILAMGDFNDTPDGSQFDLLDGVLLNKSVPLFQKGEGTIRYKGRWELIDMFLVSPDLYLSSRMAIEYIPFLMTYEKKYPGLRPLRTYSGPRYIGGVSDHCPIVLLLGP